jgi:hypothetical protein
MAESVAYLCVWSGNTKRALDLTGSRFPGMEIRELSYRGLRMSRFMQRIRLLRSVRGRAIIFYFASLDGFKHRQVLVCFHLLHRCQETVLCDTSGRWESIRNIDIARWAPGILLSLLLDLKTAIFWWFYLHFWLKRSRPQSHVDRGAPEIAYLIPSPASIGSGGGAISHIRGFLYGLRAAGVTCRVFSGTALAQDAFRNEIIAAASRSYFFWGAVMLSYNFVFARGVQRLVASRCPRFLYQRHFAFSISGAILSRRSAELDQTVRGSDATMRGQDHRGFRGAKRGPPQKRYPGRSYSSESQRRRSGLFLPGTGQNAGTQAA